MSKIDEILAEAGFPNTPEGKAAFYKDFPTKEDWESYKQMKHGGSLSGAPHNGQPTADEFFSFGDPTYGNLNIPFGNFAYGGGMDYFDEGGNKKLPKLNRRKRNAVDNAVQTSYNKMLEGIATDQYDELFYDAGLSNDKARKFMVNATGPSGATNDPGTYARNINNLLGRDVIPFPVNQNRMTEENWNAIGTGSGPSIPDMYYNDDAPASPYRNMNYETLTPIQPSISAFDPAYEFMAYGGYMDDGGDVASPMNYGAFPNTEYGGMLDQSNMDEYPVFQEGGNEFEKGGSFYSLINNLKKAKKKLFSKGGDTVMQGGNATDYPGKRREEFDNAIKTNLHNSLVEEEGNSMLEQYKQMGGPQLNPQNQAYQQMLQQNINQGQAGLNQAANNLYSSTMDVFNTMGTKDKTKVKEVKAQEGIETKGKDTKETEVNKKAAEREKLLDQIISQYQESQKQPKRDYYPYGYAPQQYGYPAHYYNQGYGMGYFPMNYGYKHSISSSDVEALKKLANNPSSNLREFSHRHFGPWSKTKMKFGYKDLYEDNMKLKDVPTFNNTPQKGFTEGFPAVHTVEGKPVEKGFQEYAANPETGPRADNQYQNMVEVNPLQRFIPKQIMMDRELQLNSPKQEIANNIVNNNNLQSLFESNQENPTTSIPAQQNIEQNIAPEIKPENNYGYTLDDYIKDKMRYEATKGSASGTGFSDFGYHETQIPKRKLTKDDTFTAPSIAKPILDENDQVIGYDPTDQELQTALDLYKKEVIPQIDYFGDDPALIGRGADFLFNTGRDPRVYMMDQYLRSKGEKGLPNRQSYNVDTKTNAWTPELESNILQQWKQYQPEIAKLPREKQIELLDQGRDWYYQNINRKNNQPSTAYGKTWKGRIEGDKKYKKYGGLAKAQVGVDTPVKMEPINALPTFSNYVKDQELKLQNEQLHLKNPETGSMYSSPEKQVEVTQKSKPKFNQEAMANWEIAGANMISSGLEQISEVAPNKRNLKASTVADNASIITPKNAISQGNTEINSGRLRSPDHTPVQFHGQSVVAYGGFMQDGGMQQQDGREQQIMQGVAQMLQQGAESEQILEQLVQMGLPEEQASEIIDTVINQLQMSEQQQPEQEQMQPAMRYGGYANGGMYEEGQELDLTPQEIAELIAQGYSIEKLG